MIGELSARVRVTYPGANTDGMAPASAVVISESANEHTLIKITHEGAPVHFTRGLITGSPLRVDTSSRTGQVSWFGYVTDVLPKGGDSGSATEVVGVGITYPMKGTSDRVWRGRTVDRYMDEVIYANGLVPYVEESTIYQTIPQAGATDWELLVKLAGLAGKNVFVTGSTVNVMSSSTAITMFGPSAPTLRRVWDDERLDVLGAMDVVRYNDTRTEDFSQVARTVDPTSSHPLVSEYGTGDYVQYGAVDARSQFTLDKKTKVVEANTRGLFLTADVEGPGNTLVGAGRPVFLNDRGQKYWWVCSRVQHSFNVITGQHRMMASIGRNSGMPADDEPPKYPVRNFNRTLSRFCMCREHEPLLVGRGRSAFITSQSDSAGTEPDVPRDSDISDWLQGGPLMADKELGPPKSWVSLARWRAQGRCRWL